MIAGLKRIAAHQEILSLVCIIVSSIVSQAKPLGYRQGPFQLWDEMAYGSNAFAWIVSEPAIFASYPITILLRSKAGIVSEPLI